MKTKDPMFIVVYGPPASGKTLNQRALMAHFKCDECFDAEHVLGAEMVVKPESKRVLVLTNDEALEDTRVKRERRTLHVPKAAVPGVKKRGRPRGMVKRPRLVGEWVSIGAARVALGDAWVEPVEGK